MVARLRTKKVQLHFVTLYVFPELENVQGGWGIPAWYWLTSSPKIPGNYDPFGRYI